MRTAAVLLIAAIALVPSAAGAQKRAGNAALGALAGAVAGAAVGYTAGHGIARDWGLSRSRPARRVR